MFFLPVLASCLAIRVSAESFFVISRLSRIFGLYIFSLFQGFSTNISLLLRVFEKLYSLYSILCNIMYFTLFDLTMYPSAHFSEYEKVIFMIIKRMYIHPTYLKYLKNSFLFVKVRGFSNSTFSRISRAFWKINSFSRFSRSSGSFSKISNTRSCRHPERNIALLLTNFSHFNYFNEFKMEV